MPFLIWLDAREALSYHQHNKLQNLAAQVSYMTGEQYDWATADWLDAEARSPLCITPRQQNHVRRQEYRYVVSWQARTNRFSKPKHPDNTMHRSHCFSVALKSIRVTEHKNGASFVRFV